MSLDGDIKNAIMKKLLSSPPQNKKTGGLSKMDLDKNLPNDEEERGGSKLSSYLEHLCGQTECVNYVELEHNYSKPWNWRADNTYAKPIKSLFINKSLNNSSSNEILDPVNDYAIPKPAYDEEKARKLMDDPWRQVHRLRSEVGDVDWEFTLDRKDWTLHQNKIFDKGCRILHGDRMGRLAYTGNWNEPVLRRISIDKSARRLRTLFSSFLWKQQLIRWLHYLWLDILHHEYLIAYVEILQSLKKKVPSLIERIILASPQPCKANLDVLFVMLQSPWDPASMALPCHTPKRLPGNPLLLIVPSGCGNINSPNSRVQRWYSHLSAIGSVMFVNTNKSNMSKVTITNSLEHLLASTRAKIAELKADYSGRNIILIGLNSGSALACQVSLVEQVSAVVCLGFPMNTVEEKRGQPDDSILNLTVPTIFVIGQHSATASINDMEDLRERLRVNTSLVVVGGADDCLRVSHSKRSSDGMTQTMVDKCIIDEVADFIGYVLLAPNYKNDSRSLNAKPRMKFVERKRKISMNDDMSPKKRIALSGGPTSVTLNMNSVNRVKKSAATSRNVGRSIKWPNDVKTNGRLSSAARRNVPDDRNKSFISRPSIDSIRIIHKNVPFKHHINSGETEGCDSYDILPEIKVIASEDYITDSNFVGHLTADRLLEMPVIIAQEDASTSTSSITGSASPQHLPPLKVMVSSAANLIRDTLPVTKEKPEIRQSALRCVVPPTTKSSTIHIGRSSLPKNVHTTLVNTQKIEENLRNSLTKCATIYFRDQSNVTTSQAQLHKLDILNSKNQSKETLRTTLNRKHFQTQLISRPRPPRIRNIPAVEHSSGDLSTNVTE